MIDLLSVKLNNNYDFVQNELPNADGTWLCTDNITGGYLKGYSYDVELGTGGIYVASRIESKQDYLIKNKIYSTIQLVCEYLNNYFPVDRQTTELVTSLREKNYPDALSLKDYRLLYEYLSVYGEFTFLNSIISGIKANPFKENDLIVVSNSQRNNYISYIGDVGNEDIQIDNTNFNKATEYALISLVNLPEQIQSIISEMIHYDIFLKDNVNNLKSESIGNYSYSKADVKIGGLYYPSEIVSGLQVYKKVKFI